MSNINLLDYYKNLTPPELDHISDTAIEIIKTNIYHPKISNLIGGHMICQIAEYQNRQKEMDNLLEEAKQILYHE